MLITPVASEVKHSGWITNLHQSPVTCRPTNWNLLKQTKKKKEFLTANDSIALSQKSSPTKFYRLETSIHSHLLLFLVLSCTIPSPPRRKHGCSHAQVSFSNLLRHAYLVFLVGSWFFWHGFFFAVWRGMLVPSPWIRCEMPWSG